jgi:hypothetical protein
MGEPVTEAEFPRLLASIERSAFRLETRPAYKLDIEQADFDRFLAGRPVPPPECDWWQPSLARTRRQTSEGKAIGRVRIVEEPPTPYQRWLLWSTPWLAEAGEDIRYLPRSRARAIGLALDCDWWLLDDSRLILMRFTDAGEVAGKELITGPEAIASYLNWRHLAVRNGIAAGELTAA